MELIKKLLAKLLVKEDDTSDGGSVNWTDIKKTLRNAVFVGVAAGLALVMDSMTDWGLSPTALALLIPSISALIDFITKMGKDNTTKE